MRVITAHACMYEPLRSDLERIRAEEWPDMPLPSGINNAILTVAESWTSYRSHLSERALH